MRERVCCVVVTYNRIALLVECVDALLAQTRAVDKILIIDNASTDGTSELLKSRGYLDKDIVEYVQLTSNIGGAGGFHEGMKQAYAEGFDWIWIMDDDTIPESGTLKALFQAYDRLPEPPKLLVSKAVWLDGLLHPINVPGIKTSNPEQALLAAQHSTVSIRYATFVSLLLHRSMIAEYGLPVADYFIWADDIEYTARILRNEFGVAVPESVVLHKTAKKHTHLTDAGPRYYYHIRNNIWMFIHSSAWSKKEKIKKASHLLREIITYLISSKFKWENIRNLTLGFKDGFFKLPRY